MRILSFVLALAGLAVATLLVGWFGFDRVAESLASIGWHGFALFTLVQLALFAWLGLAWFALIPPGGPARRAWVFIWGRAVRDSTGNLLPFSQLGGFALGARAVTLHGVGWATATASTMADVTMEFGAQLAFALVGLAALAIRVPDSRLVLPIAMGVGVAILGAAGFVWAQHGASGLFQRIGGRIVGGRLGNASHQLAQVQTELSRIYARPLVLAMAGMIHFLGWVLTGIGSWIAYRLLGADIDLFTALGIEGLLSAALSFAFLVPVAAGVQEAAYAALGAAFGVPPEMSLVVSLLRRARDLVLGVPVLLIWQAVEVRRLRARPATRPASATPPSRVPPPPPARR